MSLAKGDLVTIEILSSRPTMFTTQTTVRRLTGTYLGIPRFETTIANVRVGDKFLRLPLEYLTPAS